MSRRSSIIVTLIGLAGLAAGTMWSNQIRSLIGLGKSESNDTALTESQPGTSAQLWTCGMHPQVIQEQPGDCPICHMDLTPLKVDNQAHNHGAGGQATTAGTAGAAEDTTASADRKVRYWWDPMMSPPYISDKPGKSPMGMDLVPVYEDEAPMPTAGSVVTIDPTVVQNMGVRTALVTEAPLRRSIRVVGYLDEAQPNIRDINLLVSGWIKRLHADTEGMHVEQGDPLFDLYSPELRVAIDELITARRSLNELGSASDGMERRTAQTLYDAAVQKLELWDLPRAQIDTLAKLDRAPEVVTFVSPLTGDITEKPVVEGAAVMAGDRALRIVDHTTLWIDSQVFEKDLPFIRLGQKAEASLASRPGQCIEGEVIFIHPRVDAMTRTAMVRLAIPNPDLTLRPGMYATVRLEAELAERAVMVPREAIIDTGDRQVAFVVSGGGDGRFEPRMVTMGHAGDNGMVQVLEGLAPGEPVVVSGQFLLDAESRLREAIQKFLAEKTQMSAASGAPAGAQPIAHESAATATAETPAELAPKIDAVVAAYLRMSEALGATQAGNAPLDAEALVAAAHDLHAALQGTPEETLVMNIANSGDALKHEPLDQQREKFKALSDAVIALVDRYPPSSAVAERLYVIYCPMAPGHWMQTIDRVNNPYYATSMKQCGEVVRAVTVTQRGGSQ